MTSGQAPRATPVTRAEFERWARTRTGDPGIELRETHVSIIALGRERVYKLKKPVRLPFVDQSTAERRRAICGREVTLNRRLAPDVYLGVVDVTGDGGEVVDCAVEMRRMPDDRRLSALVSSGTDVRPCLDALASLLATFHARAARGDEIDAAATAPAIGRAWATELAEMGITESRVGMLARRFIAGRDELFAQRIAAGRVCDGHGDLLADDVFCLPDGPRALDCLEFDDHLRFADGLADAAFCAMSLEQLGRADLAEHFLGCYGGAAGDHWPRSLAHHYVARRALVRSKVAGLRARAEEAAQLLALTLDHLERGRVRLVLVGGPPATGKSTLARDLGADTGWVVLRSDVVRKELAGIDPMRPAGAPLDRGIYDAAWTERTYAELLARAAAALRTGESVIADASWSDPAPRAAAARLASATSSDLVAFRCSVPLELARERAATRARAHADPSDATAGLTAALAARFADWPGAVVLDTARPPREVVAEARRAAGPA